MASDEAHPRADDSFLSRIVDVFLYNDIAPLLILISLIGGAVAL